MKGYFLIIWLLCTTTSAFGQHYRVDTLYKTGPLDNRINVVILGDGFMQEEMPKFAAEAKKFSDFFRSYEPFDRYRDYFNFFAIRTPSKDSGITNPGTAPDAYPDQPVEKKETFFGVSFGEQIHRLLTITKREVYSDLLASHLPAYDLVILLANTRYYGGAGGGVAIFSLEEQSNNIGVHEIGHTLADLADEYWQEPYGFYSREGPNITANGSTNTVKWKNWLNSPPIGVYQYGSEGEAARWYKPAQGTCLMEYINNGYCAVCREAVVERILGLVSPVDRVSPDTSAAIKLDKEVAFKLHMLKPSPNSLRIEWILNGKRISLNRDELIFKPHQVPDGSVLTATVFDSTALSRRNGAGNQRTKTIHWTLRSALRGVFEVVASADTVCAGDTITLTSYGCAGKLRWSTGQSARSISVAPSGAAIYKAECKTDDSPPLTFEIPVTVLPLPEAIAGNGGPYTVGQTVVLTASGGEAYRWSGPRNFTANTATASIPDAGIYSSGVYDVKVTGENGCSKTLQTEVKIEPVLSVDHEQRWLNISPNPARNLIRLETRLPGESRIVFYDQAGRVVLSKQFQSKTEVIIDVPEGIYIYRFTNGSREAQGKVAVQ
ncbi:M64 family metallopeptidase [Dyadobacter sp. 676]|uniref:M64 family metallopeptidase n=1 Tax=Dyadobacter sp. 676 TaxID=3088362 RepID=A0AAU8FLI2_9BACT